MSYPISLVDANSADVLVISDPATETPYAVQSLQVGGADVRAVTNNRPQADGTLDVTQFAGAAAVTCALTVLPDPDAHAYVDVLRSWVHPRRRSYLTVLRGGWDGPRRMLVRGDALTAPTVIGTGDGPMVTLQLAWRAIDGVWESADEGSWTIFPGGATTTGLTFPITFPISFGSGTPPGSGLVNLSATAQPTPPTIRIYGPVTAPGVTNATTGLGIQFVSSFSLPAGQYVSIDCAAGTVLANDDPTLSRFNSVDWSLTDLWQLQPGTNQIQFTGTGLSGVTQAVVTWRERTA